MAFEFPIRVYWEDTDAGGIVFYANYLKFFERARTEWLRSLGIGQQALRESTGGMFVVGETSVRYRRPARLDDELLVTARVQESGRASLIIAQQAKLITRVENTLSAAGPPRGAKAPLGGSAAAPAASVGALICDGTIRIGWVQAETLKPGRIPPTILEALEK
ncbi:MAG: YbgC/FadM family acyl-CoA thioesterase [Ramlibacter sp.]|nr:YbgC/FadM family acyl-CoA thioesterase [Ramlibacter sp.]